MTRSRRTLLLSSLPLLGATGCDPDPVQQARYHYGGEVNIVCACTAGLCYWVRAEPAVADALKQFVLKQTDEPYQPVYLTFRGHPLDETPVGFAANYDGLMAVTEVLTLSVTVPEDCAAP